MKVNGRRILKIIIQVVAIFGINEVGGLIVKLADLPIPGSMVGLVLLFLALKLRIVKLTWVEVGGNWLIREMLIFFVPSAVGMMMFGSLLLHQGLQIILVIAISTLFVMLSTGVIAELLTRYRQKRQQVNEEIVE